MRALFFALLLLPSALFAMSLEEKVGGVLMVHLYPGEADELVRELHVGGVIYFKWASDLATFQQAVSRADRPLLVAVDQEGGRIARLLPAPSSAEIVATGDLEYAREQAMQVGQALRAAGFNLNLAPVVDIDTSGYIGDRSFGENPEQVIAYAEATLKGYHQAEVITSLKHFPGHGSVSTDSHKGLPVIEKSLEELEVSDLRPFRALAKRSETITTGHLFVPALDLERCVTLSPRALGYLRETIGFEGVIISDSLVMGGVLEQAGTVEEAAIQALLAGCDLLQLGGSAALTLRAADVRCVHTALVEAVRSGRIPESRLDEALTRLQKLHFFPSKTVI